MTDTPVPPGWIRKSDSDALGALLRRQLEAIMLAIPRPRPVASLLRDPARSEPTLREVLDGCMRSSGTYRC